MRKLFVNADDFGLTEGVCAGILAAMESGVVGGSTAMVCAPGALERIVRLGSAVAGRLGLHLQLTSGVPCLPPGDVPSLVGADGAFARKKTAVVDVDPGEVRREWRAQLDRFLSTGLAPSHLDSHHHIHNRPEIFPVFVELARELGVPARALSDGMRRSFDAAGVPHADVCVTRFFGRNLTAGSFLSLVDAAFAALGGSGVVEVMAHPGKSDAALAAISSYVDGREDELRVLLQPGLLEILAERGVTVVDAAGLSAGPAWARAAKR